MTDGGASGGDGRASWPGVDDLTSGRLLARNTVLNLVGQGAPLLVGLVSIPILIGAIGTERFGVLGIAWVVIGYFGLVDLGLGRALTQLVSERLGSARGEEVPELAWTALLLMACLGTAGGALVYVGSGPLVERVFNVPAGLEAESLLAFRLLALSIPAVVLSTGFRALLEATQRFGVINAIRIPASTFTYLGPLLVLPFSRSIAVIVAMLLVGRLLTLGAFAYFSLRALPGTGRRVAIRRALVKPLLRFGGWISVSNVISPLLTYVDRLLIGAVLTMSAVAYYTTPYEVVTRLWMVPGAVTMTFFPAFAATFMRDGERTAALFQRAARSTLAVLFPLVLAVFLFAPEWLDLWVGAEFAREGAAVARWLSVGILINGVAYVAFSLLQGIGRPDLTAKLHLAETPFYLLLLWWALGRWGIAGAAFAWTARVAVDAGLLFLLSARVLPEARAGIFRLAAWGALACGLLGVGLLPATAVGRGLVLVVGLTVLGAAVWREVGGVDGGRRILRDAPVVGS